MQRSFKDDDWIQTIWGLVALFAIVCGAILITYAPIPNSWVP